MTLSLRNCPFAYRCERQWTQLKKTADPDVRFCTECQQEVHRCHTDAELTQAIALNRCVALRLDDFLQADGELAMGMMAPPPHRR